MDTQRTARRSRVRSRKHLLFWIFPLFFAAVLSFALWTGMGYVMGKAVPVVENILAKVMIL